MSRKLLALPFLLALSLDCFADVVKVSDNEPLSKHLGMLIDMRNMEFVQKTAVGSGKFLLVEPGLASAKLVRDPTTGLNHFNGLIGYNLFVNGVEESATRYLYFQCPITRDTYIDRSVPYYEMVEGKKTHVGSSVELDTLKTEHLSQGYYRFLSSPKNKNSAFDAAFPMSGKVNEHPDIDSMCLQINIAYLEFSNAEFNRADILKRFGVSE